MRILCPIFCSCSHYYYHCCYSTGFAVPTSTWLRIRIWSLHPWPTLGGRRPEVFRCAPAPIVVAVVAVLRVMTSRRLLSHEMPPQSWRYKSVAVYGCVRFRGCVCDSAVSTVLRSDRQRNRYQSDVLRHIEWLVSLQEDFCRCHFFCRVDHFRSK